MNRAIGHVQNFDVIKRVCCPKLKFPTWRLNSIKSIIAHHFFICLLLIHFFCQRFNFRPQFSFFFVYVVHYDAKDSIIHIHIQQLVRIQIYGGGKNFNFVASLIHHLVWLFSNCIDRYEEKRSLDITEKYDDYIFLFLSVALFVFYPTYIYTARCASTST